MEAMWTRTNPLLRKAVALVASGDLGDIRHVSADFASSAFRGRRPIGCSIRQLPAVPSSTPASIRCMS